MKSTGCQCQLVLPLICLCGTQILAPLFCNSEVGAPQTDRPHSEIAAQLTERKSVVRDVLDNAKLFFVVSCVSTRFDCFGCLCEQAALEHEAQRFSEMAATPESECLIGLFEGSTALKKNRFGKPAQKVKRGGNCVTHVLSNVLVSGLIHEVAVC